MRGAMAWRELGAGCRVLKGFALALTFFFCLWWANGPCTYGQIYGKCGRTKRPYNILVFEMANNSEQPALFSHLSSKEIGSRGLVGVWSEVLQVLVRVTLG